MVAQSDTHSKGLILVVDDYAALRHCLRDTLELVGYTVTTAQNGLDGLHTLLDMDALPDLIMTDLKMEQLGGFQLMEAVRSEARWQDIPFLFVSGQFSETSDLDRLSCLPKPFSLEQLVTTVENTLMPISM